MDEDASAPQPSPAGFWVRGGALLIDTVIMLAFSFLPLPTWLLFFTGFTYHAVFTAWRGQTPGKMAAGIKVVRATGGAVGVGQALGRTAAQYVSAVALGTGYLPAAFSKKRALHDYIAGTRVVYVDGVGAGRKAASAGLGVLSVFLMLAVVAGELIEEGLYDRFNLLMVLRAEGRSLHNLASLRIALEDYAKSNQGRHPAALEELIGPRYLPAIPLIQVRSHEESRSWTLYGPEVCSGEDVDDAKLKDTGGWGYVADPRAECAGFVFIDCTHPDSKGRYLTRR